MTGARNLWAVVVTLLVLAPPANAALVPGTGDDAAAHLQELLIWTGNYKGFVDGKVGAQTLEAISLFQSSQGNPPSGDLGPDELRELERLAKVAQKWAGFQMITDDQTGSRIGIPYGYVTRPGTVLSNGTRWSAADGSFDVETFALRDTDTLDSVQQSLCCLQGRTLDYQFREGVQFLLQGSDNNGSRKFFVRVAQSHGQLLGFTVTYDVSRTEDYFTTVNAIASSFDADPANPEASRNGLPSGGAPYQPPAQSAAEPSVAAISPDVIALNSRIQDLQQKLEGVLVKVGKEAPAPVEPAAGPQDLSVLLKRITQLEADLATAKKSADLGSASGSVIVHDGPKVALVVGINTYDNLGSDSELKKAVNDARSVKTALEGLGFKVIEAEDTRRQEFNRVWQQFLNEIKPKSAVAFYFAGHGGVIENSNYLLPRDIPQLNKGDEALFKSEGLSVNTLMDDLQQRHPKLAFVVIDACRNNPFHDPTRSISVSQRGLAPLQRVPTAPSDDEPGEPFGTYILFSAGDGEAALDRLDGDTASQANSVFTRSLLPLLPKLSIKRLAEQVSLDVTGLAKTEHYQQHPAKYDSLRVDVCLTNACNR